MRGGSSALNAPLSVCHHMYTYTYIYAAPKTMSRSRDCYIVASVWLVCFAKTFLTCARTTLITLDFALPSSCRSLALTLRTDWYHSMFRLVSQGKYVKRCSLVRRGWPRQLPKGKKSALGVFSGIPMVLLLSVWVCYLLFASRSGLNSRGGVPGVHAAGGTPTKNYTQKYRHKYRGARTKIQMRKQKQRRAPENTNTTKNNKKRAKSTDARKHKT